MECGLKTVRALAEGNVLARWIGRVMRAVTTVSAMVWNVAVMPRAIRRVGHKLAALPKLVSMNLSLVCRVVLLTKLSIVVGQTR